MSAHTDMVTGAFSYSGRAIAEQLQARDRNVRTLTRRSSPAGSTVEWVYRDGFCDSIEECSGHNVVFEDGTSEGTNAGFARARNGPTSISATITQQPGELI
ncbi:MAG: hypothetical protein KY393_04770, partial [Actinobacteria bacterium]|nr:hypothetical protein [Actinomycetota bacterium]